MTTWPELLASALVGTDRRAAADPGAAGALLDSAAAASVYRRAGVRPAADVVAPEPAPDEAVPAAGTAAMGWLAPLLDTADGAITEHRCALVAEWLRIAVARGRRVPPELLPALLDAGRRRADLRPLIAAAGGLRAGWLAAQNPEWTDVLAGSSSESSSDSGSDSGSAAASADSRRWHEGTRDQRTGYLAAARRAEAASARELLAAEWSGLPADERAQLLAVLGVGLGPDDEDFLENALDDKRREVRDGAADLLARLPGSGYNRRMADRARDCLVARGKRIEVRPPSTCDKPMQRDGITPRPSAGTGVRAWWLEQILARAPLSSLTTMPPAQYLALSIEDGWVNTVRMGLAAAAGAQRDPAWAAALLDVLSPRQPPNRRWPVEDLYAALAADEAARRSIIGLRDPGAGIGRSLERLLERCPAPWPDALTAAALAGIAVHVRHTRMPYDLYAVCRLAGLRMPADRVAEAARLADRFREEQPGNGRVGALDGLTETLTFRHDMTEETW